MFSCQYHHHLKKMYANKWGINISTDGYFQTGPYNVIKQDRMCFQWSHVVNLFHFYFYFTKIKYIITNICFCLIFSEAKDINVNLCFTSTETVISLVWICMKTMFLTSEFNIEQNDENHKSITLVVCRTFLMIHIIVSKWQK